MTFLKGTKNIIGKEREAGGVEEVSLTPEEEASKKYNQELQEEISRQRAEDKAKLDDIWNNLEIDRILDDLHFTVWPDDFSKKYGVDEKASFEIFELESNEPILRKGINAYLSEDQTEYICLQPSGKRQPAQVIKEVPVPVFEVILFQDKIMLNLKTYKSEHQPGTYRCVVKRKKWRQAVLPLEEVPDAPALEVNIDTLFSENLDLLPRGFVEGSA